jgi:S-layer homology domain
MTRLARRLLAASLSAALLPCALTAQSYGIGDQSIVIGAAAFVGQNLNLEGDLRSDGYLYQPNFLSTFSAPVTLPDGAVITQICLYSVNFKQGSTLQLQFEAVKLAGGGTAPAVVPIPGASVTADFLGHNFVCTGPLAYTFHDLADVDGDQVPERVAHRLSVAFTPLDDTLGLGGVRILWHRQISTPPPAATFGDVPSSHLFFLHVEALAASAITGGCGNGNYCPESPLTRGQMAVFLSKALGLHWPN